MPGALVPAAHRRRTKPALLVQMAAVAQGLMPRAGGESWAALMCGVT